MKGILKLLMIIILVIGTCGCKDKKVEESDANARAALIVKIKAQPESANIIPKVATTGNDTIDDTNAFIPQPFPVVSIKDFFEGNKDLGSIGCNLTDHPGIPKFYEVLKGIKAKDNVQDVLVEVSDIDEQFGPWPFSEIVYILTSASKEEVGKWMAPLQPDEIFEGWGFQKAAPSAAPKLKDGMRVFGAWWD